MQATGPTSFDTLPLYRNFYTLGEVSEYKHRFEVYFKADYSGVLLLRGNTPEEIGPYPMDCHTARIDDSPYRGFCERVAEKPQRFKDLNLVPETLKHLADAVSEYVRKNWYGKAVDIQVRYEGSKRQIDIYEFIKVYTVNQYGAFQSFKQVWFKGFHGINTPHIETERPLGCFGEMFYKFKGEPQFIPFIPSESTQGRMLLANYKKPEFQADWQRLSAIVLDKIDRNVLLPFPLIPAKIKQYFVFEVGCYGRESLAPKKESENLFFGDDGSSKRLNFVFELSDALQRTIIQTEELAQFNLKISVRMRLQEASLDLTVTGRTKEHTETMKFIGKIDSFEGQPVLTNDLEAVVDLPTGGKKRRDHIYNITLIDGDKYKTVDVYPKDRLSLSFLK